MRAQVLCPSLPSLGRSRGCKAPALAFTSDFPSAPAPKLPKPAFFTTLRPSRPRASPLPYLRLPPRPRRPPSTPDPGSPGPSAGRQLQSPVPRFSGSRRLRQKAKLLTWLLRLLSSATHPGSALCSSSPPIRNSPGRRLRPPCSARTTFGSDAQAEGVEPR